MAERIRTTIASTALDTRDGPLRVTASFGIAMLEPDDAGPETVLVRADRALYAAKAAGRNRVVCEPRPTTGPDPFVAGPPGADAHSP